MESSLSIYNKNNDLQSEIMFWFMFIMRGEWLVLDSVIQAGFEEGKGKREE